MKKRLLSISLTLCMIVANVSALGVFALAEEATEAVTYLKPVYIDGDYTKGLASMEEATCTEYTEITSDMLSKNRNILYSGWYVVRDGMISTSRVKISGDVKLILVNGCYWEVPAVVVNNDGPEKCNSLEIFGQSGNSGRLRTTGTSYAGIGGSYECANGNIVINGGDIYAIGGKGAGIGSGSNYYDTSVPKARIIINAGNIEAYGGVTNDKASAAIGGGYNASGENIYINGGRIFAKANGRAAAIGGGEGGNGKNITIQDSLVKAFGGDGSAGIGGGCGGYAEGITIRETKSDATDIDAYGGYNGAGIGGGKHGYGKLIMIQGGSVTAVGGTNAAGIGGGINANADDVQISNTKLIAVGGTNAEAIGSGQGGEETTTTQLIYEDGGEYQISCDGQPANFISTLNGVKEIIIEPNKSKSGKHNHKWTYSSEGSTITATCSAAGHRGLSQYVIQLSAPDDCAYDGSAKAVKLNGTIAGVKTPAVKYYKGSKLLKKAPSAIGTYTAKMALGKATASLTYTIAKAEDIEKYNANVDAISDIQLIQNAAVANKNGKITVSWAAAEGYELSSYEIYRATSENGKYTKVGTVKAGTLKYVNAKNLKKGKTYYYKVHGTAKFGALIAYTDWSDVQLAKCRKNVK